MRYVILVLVLLALQIKDLRASEVDGQGIAGLEIYSQECEEMTDEGFKLAEANIAAFGGMEIASQDKLYQETTVEFKDALESYGSFIVCGMAKNLMKADGAYNDYY